MQVYKNIYPIVMCVCWNGHVFTHFLQKNGFLPLLLIFRGENDLKRDFIYKTFTKYLHELQ